MNVADDEKRIAPIPLPAGSFDLQELQEKLDHAVSVKDVEQHPERINKAIAECIATPELLTRADEQAVPFGATEVEDEIVYVEGGEPVKRKTYAFDAADAKSGEEAARMAYDPLAEKKKDGKTPSTAGLNTVDARTREAAEGANEQK